MFAGFDLDAAPWRTNNYNHGVAKLIKFLEWLQALPDELTAELTQRYGFNNAFSSLEQPMEGDYVQLLKAELPILLPKLTKLMKISASA